MGLVPQGQRPADVIGNAIEVARIARGENKNTPDGGKEPKWQYGLDRQRQKRRLHARENATQIATECSGDFLSC